MYLEFYGLKEAPFSITPDPRDTLQCVIGEPGDPVQSAKSTSAAGLTLFPVTTQPAVSREIVCRA